MKNEEDNDNNAFISSKLANNILLITANVGTLFENLDNLVDRWLDELFLCVDKTHTKFIALHMQEVGGKNYKSSMSLVDQFFKKLLLYVHSRHFDRYFCVFDTDYTDDLKFTALGNLYFIHRSIKNIKLLNYKSNQYTSCLHREIYCGNLDSNQYIHKERFEKSFFKNFPWSRKGFIATKWCINDQEISLINIHLFHDPSNIEALNHSPSLFSENRKNALEYTIRNLINTATPFAIFGDFNFRLDTSLLVKNYSHIPNTIEVKDDSNQICELIFRDLDKKETFSIKTKQFKCHNGCIELVNNETGQLLKYDKELEPFDNVLYEYEKTFPPSYPFLEEDESIGSNNSSCDSSETVSLKVKYMQSRCPAWCDRILMNDKFKGLINHNKLKHLSSQMSLYNLIGMDTCMGDHKPVYLVVNIDKEQEELSDQNNNEIKQQQNIDVEQYDLNEIAYQLTKKQIEEATAKISMQYNYNNDNITSSSILGYNLMPFNYLIINNYLYDLNNKQLTNVHNYSKFTNLEALLPHHHHHHHHHQKSSTSSAIAINEEYENYFYFIENNYQDNYAIKKFFLNELNANLFKYKELINCLKDKQIIESITKQHQQQVSVSSSSPVQQQNNYHLSPVSQSSSANIPFNSASVTNSTASIINQNYLIFKLNKYNDIAAHLSAPNLIKFLLSQHRDSWRDVIYIDQQNKYDSSINNTNSSSSSSGNKQTKDNNNNTTTNNNKKIKIVELNLDLNQNLTSSITSLNKLNQNDRNSERDKLNNAINKVANSYISSNTTEPSTTSVNNLLTNSNTSSTNGILLASQQHQPSSTTTYNISNGTSTATQQQQQQQQRRNYGNLINDKCCFGLLYCCNSDDKTNKTNKDATNKHSCNIM